MGKIPAAGAVCALIMGFNCAVEAQNYPARTVRFIVPYVPGGGVDFVD